MNKTTKIILLVFWLLVILCEFIWIIMQLSHKNSEEVKRDVSRQESGAIRIDGCYYKLNNQIYCGGIGSVYNIPDVDISSFQVIEHIVAKDKNHVYVTNQIYPNLDAQTFRKYYKEGLNLYGLFADKSGIYNMDSSTKLVPIGLNVDTATSVDPFYIRDENGIYFNDYSITKMNNVDPRTFRILGGCASVETFYAEYVADNNHVFVGTEILPGIDPNHFVRIATIQNDDGEMPYAFFLWKDTSTKKIYVYCGTHIKEADYDTFEYKDGRTQDKNNYYNFNTGGGSYTVSPKSK